jgi:hypothetical protein
MQTVRTTIRIRKDLLDQSRLIALKKGTSLQDVINDTLARGIGHVSDLTSVQEAMKRIDAFRESQAGKRIDVKKLLSENRKDLP